MANMIPISTVTVGSGGASSIDFTSIPATYTDLCLVYSSRTNRSGNNNDQMFITFNSNTTSYSWRWLSYDGTNVISQNVAKRYAGESTGNSATANTFSNVLVYIPNYAGSNNKSYSVDSVLESNTTFSYNMSLEAGLWSNTAAITSISLTSETSSTIQQYSSATLYGIRKY